MPHLAIRSPIDLAYSYIVLHIGQEEPRHLHCRDAESIIDGLSKCSIEMICIHMSGQGDVVLSVDFGSLKYVRRERLGQDEEEEDIGEKLSHL